MRSTRRSFPKQREALLSAFFKLNQEIQRVEGALQSTLEMDRAQQGLSDKARKAREKALRKQQRAALYADKKSKPGARKKKLLIALAVFAVARRGFVCLRTRQPKLLVPMDRRISLPRIRRQRSQQIFRVVVCTWKAWACRCCQQVFRRRQL